MVDRLHWTPERRSINQSPIDVVDVVIAIAREKEWEDKRKERLTSSRLKSRNSIANNVAASILLANSLSLQSHSCRILSASQSQRGDSRRRKRKRKKLGSCRSHVATTATGKRQEVGAVRR